MVLISMNRPNRPGCTRNFSTSFQTDHQLVFARESMIKDVQLTVIWFSAYKLEKEKVKSHFFTLVHNRNKRSKLR